MRVGVVIEDTPYQVGGEYSFQKDVLDGFLSLCKQSCHEFVLFVPGSFSGVLLQQLALSSSKIEVVSYTVPTVLYFLGCAARRFKLYHLEQVGTIESLLLRHKIQFVWFMKPARYPVNIPYLTIVWDLQHRRQPWFPEVSQGIRWQNRETMYEMVLQRAAVVLASNSVGKAEVERFYGVASERVLAIAHPTPQFALSAGSEPTTERSDLRQPFLMYPAQFWPHKNHVSLLKAIRCLKDDHGLDFKLLFTGSDRGNASHVRKMAKDIGVEDRVEFLGFVPQKELISLYRNAFALAYLSLFGPENLPPLEAMALGCPVIIGDVPGHREQLGEAALYVDPVCPQSIAGAVKKLHTEPDLRRALLKAGRARAQAWTSLEFVRTVFGILDDFAPIRGCWE